MKCIVCKGPAQLSTRHANGCPLQTPICEDCFYAVTRRQVGIVRLADGAYDVTDGRKFDRASVEHLT